MCLARFELFVICLHMIREKALIGRVTNTHNFNLQAFGLTKF